MSDIGDTLACYRSEQMSERDMVEICRDRPDVEAALVESSIAALATAQAEADALRAEIAQKDARTKQLHTLLYRAGSLLEANVRTKTRDDHAEQKMIMAIRDALNTSGETANDTG